MKRLSARLVGHPSKCPSLAPWHDNIPLEWRLHEGIKHVPSLHCDWTTGGPVRVDVGGRRSWHWHREKSYINESRSSMRSWLSLLIYCQAPMAYTNSAAWRHQAKRLAKRAHDWIIHTILLFAVSFATFPPASTISRWICAM